MNSKEICCARKTKLLAVNLLELQDDCGKCIDDDGRGRC